jgi:hypothetical protein
MLTLSVRLVISEWGRWFVMVGVRRWEVSYWLVRGWRLVVLVIFLLQPVVFRWIHDTDTVVPEAAINVTHPWGDENNHCWRFGNVMSENLWGWRGFHRHSMTASDQFWQTISTFRFGVGRVILRSVWLLGIFYCRNIMIDDFVTLIFLPTFSSSLSLQCASATLSPVVNVFLY